MGLDRYLRRIVPSTARLTYNPLFKVIVDSFDVLPKRAYRELANIPPNHLRIRVGVANRLFTNHINFVTGAKNFWMHAFHSGLCRLDSTIVDIGCGCGRFAHIIRDYIFKSEKFSGRYIGIDVDQEMLEWCCKNFDPERFEFHHSTHASKAYHAEGDTRTYYHLPIKEDQADFVFSTSLFTHLLEKELINYCEESYRVLKDGGQMAMYCFSMTHLPPTYGDRHTFSHRMGNAYVESLAVPEAAVAYSEEFLFSVVRKIGFRHAEIQTASGDWQPMLLCRK